MRRKWLKKKTFLKRELMRLAFRLTTKTMIKLKPNGPSTQVKKDSKSSKRSCNKTSSKSQQPLKMFKI